MPSGKPATQTTNATSSTQPWAPTQPGLNALLGQIVGTPAGGGGGYPGGGYGAPQMPGGSGPVGMIGRLMSQGQPQGGAMGGPLSGGLLGNVGLTGTEDSALNSLMANAQSGNPYAPAIGGLATDLLAGGKDRTGMAQGGYDAYKSQLSPYTTMDTNPYSNEAFTKFAGGLQSNITDSLKSQYAGAGYSPTSSGDYGSQLGEGIAKGLAPSWMQAYYQNEGLKRGAQDSLYGAGNTTTGLLSNLDQTSLANRQAGIGVASSALQARDAPYMQQLALEAQRRNIPVQNTAAIANLLYPMAQLGKEGQMQSTSTMTPATPSPLQSMMSLGIGAAGLMSGNPGMAAGGLLGGLGGGWGGMGIPQVNPWTQGGVGTAGAWGL